MLKRVLIATPPILIVSRCFSFSYITNPLSYFSSAPEVASSVSTPLTFIASGACRGKQNVGKDIERSPSVPLQCNCGEDAYYISPNSLGIADGVGGWAEQGIDSSKISRQLMHCSKAIADSEISSFGGIQSEAIDILDNAYEDMVDSGEVDAGSTTACIVTLKADGNKMNIEGANLGDSGYMVIRDGKIIFRSREQQVPGVFNAPFQLAIYPPHMSTRGAIINSPSDADSYAVSAEEGDIVVVATDGLFDNLFDQNILDIVTSEMKLAKSAMGSDQLKGIVADQTARCSQKLLIEGLKRAADSKWKSPFSVNAMRAGYYTVGGKWDDISVIVARVTAL
eukprot:TRINITY_DN8428_c0_g1_i1.p1 TRINITY_DN8428_c0_g1~~TRINITY_DN8428_c0_g1_i1.p1  ORF type:complete len:338 (-),score=87.74 TRINITY_DN8428_c0_g1_i1:8-1021(-)